MKRRTVRIGLGLLLASSLVLTACGEDEEAANAAAPPTIGEPVIECAAYSGEGNLGDYEGDVLISITVPVTDDDGDLNYVDATVDGAVFRLVEGAEANEWTYTQGGSTNEIARCMTGTTIEFRAVDAAGGVTTRTEVLE